MNWKERIKSKYKFSRHGRFLVQDKKGILSSPNFLSFLDSKNISYQIIDSLNQLIKVERSNFEGIVFADIPLITRSVKSKFTNIEVNSFTLPFDVSKEVYDLLSVNQYIQLIKYIVEEDYTNAINLRNYNTVIYDASKREYLQKKKTLIKKIHQSLEKDFAYDELLLFGSILGYLEYSDYKFKIDTFKLSGPLRNKVRRYILSEEFKNIFFEPVSNPKTVDKILSHIVNKKEDKIALICFDCMGFAEWNLLKDFLGDYSFIENQVFALIPTITSISRKAILGADNIEIYNNKNTDRKLFTRNFSVDDNVQLFADSKSLSQDNIIGFDKICKIYNIFDDIAHSVVFSDNTKSKNRYFDSIISYLKSSSIKNDFKLLKQNNYKLYFCSDHGNIFAKGNGVKVDKWMVEESGKRSYIVDDSNLLSDLSFDMYKIPFVKNKYVILADENEMFNHKNSKGLVHGGISLSELVVPFIEVIK